MFSPTQSDVRRFFVDARRKRGQRLPLTPLETIAADWIEAHPEYGADLGAAAAEPAVVAPPEPGRENPFLHLSMHLSISEQLSIDQPAGIRDAFERLARRLGSQHAAQHEVMDCLGRMLFDAQRAGTPPDGEAYVECVRRRAAQR